MWGTTDNHAPANPTHRLSIAIIGAVFGILAVGDALNVIVFPMYQLGLPDTALANTVVFLFGGVLLVTTYRLVQLSIDDPTTGGTPDLAMDGSTGQYDDRDPEQILEARYARGELTESEFEQMLARLDSSDVADDTEYDHARDFAENHELHTKETVID